MSAPLIQFSIYERAQHFWVRHIWMDFVIALAVVGGWVAVAALVCSVPYGLTAVPNDARRLLYQILATASATMGGFTLTSISILVNLLRTPMKTIDQLLPAADKRRVGSVFLNVLPWLLGLFVVAIIAVLTDANVAQGYWSLQSTVIGMAMAAACAIGRVVWVLRRLLVVTTD
ncbi:hypothetical protein [Mycobacteroides abscessus]|uniref:hypothetical protein n=1 Tax=Mycobacteroides abscessus TaxID=36809 RepID=UPI0009265624|nr:hypothetical protein [Mycobacteroides abscessus]PVA78670.1 hypothetical protein DDJ37_08900 [Mycobacteroides abscessus]PVB20212.1 hypothetical protein DDJ40_11000 [Mycobacteroides abscessus]RIR68074.1 hypothetical protein D2E62_03150 [Mycobacteroides abscessus]SHR30245.1 Uncharacterised protein [Mycobacteroides abscessus subsp. abscessus]